MDALNYLLQTNLYLIIFMMFYMVVLRNETFFGQNRFYLNASVFLSFLGPLISADWVRNLFVTQKLREAIPHQMLYETVVVGAGEEPQVFSATDIILWSYAAVTIFLLCRLIFRLFKVGTTAKTKKGAAFSFFNKIVVDHDLPGIEAIINHEKVHTKQWHSADILFIELAAIINWFNPVMLLYKKEIRHIHEFIADEKAADLMPGKSDYAALLFSNALGVAPNQLVNNFFNKSLLKRRIIMLNKSKSRRTGLWKYGFSVPLFILLLIVSSAAVRSQITVTFPSNTGIVTTTDNNFTLPVVSDSKPGNSSTETTEVVPTSPVPEKQETVHDFASLKRHIQRTVKYPTSAKENSVTGFTIANFNVRAKKIADVKILKSLNKDIDDEVIRTLGSYQDTLDVPDDIYAIAFVFKLVGSEGTAEQMPNISTKNFAGQIIVMAMGKQEAKSAKGFPVSQDESVNDFSRVDILPEFPGGIAGWADYLRTTLRYPKLARDNNIQGRVILSFVVNKDGSLSDIKVLRGIGGGADEEAIRVLTSSPAWKPGIVNGEAVKVAYTLPINFTLSQDVSEEKPVEQKND